MASRSYHLAVVTSALTFLLILLGEFTAVSASGATCGLNWPTCGGQLLPFGLPIHDFIEWFHRFVAMIVGFFILGTGVVAWRNYAESRITYGAILAVVLLPVQVMLGATTVTINGLVPWGYAPAVQAVHHLAALAIYAALVATTLWIRDADGGRTARSAGVGRVRSAALAGLALLPVQLLLSRGTVLAYTIRVQLVHHAVELVTFTAVLAALVWAFEARAARAKLASTAALALVVVQILLGVGVVPYTGGVRIGYYVLALAVGALLVLTARSPLPVTAGDAASGD